MTLLFITGMPGWAEIVVIAFVGLLLFGRRLPEVGRSLGRTIVEFKKGIREVETEVNVASTPRNGGERTLPPAQEQTTLQLDHGKVEAKKPAQESSPGS